MWKHSSSENEHLDDPLQLCPRSIPDACSRIKNDFQICRACLADGIKMYNLDTYNLKQYYDHILRDEQGSDLLPNYLCFECTALVLKYYAFKQKCIRACKSIQQMASSNPHLQISLESFHNINRIEAQLTSSLETNNQSRRLIVKYDETGITDEENVTISHDKATIKIEIPNVNKIQPVDHKIPLTSLETTTLSNDSMFKMIKCKKETKLIRSINISDQEKNKIDKTKWNIVVLNEEEAFREFNKRGHCNGYQNAPYNCNLCLKGFSSLAIMQRHLPLHSEQRGCHECRMCKKRFKWKNKLNCHMNVHLVRYHCKRCGKVCVMMSQVKLHEKYHDGLSYTCKLCDAKFRKVSTYYSHVRLKHRSDFICKHCGESFVSEVGLHQHKARRHPENNQLNEDDSICDNLTCNKCDIKFENKEACENHVQHAANHMDEGGYNNDKSLLLKPRKVTDKKTTICTWCGEVLQSNSACLRHIRQLHAESTNQRQYVCEICGASISWSSIRQHRNSHTKELRYPCTTCGRVFHTPANRHRHQVTHTGEKPFACVLCEKRFTQRTNLKLHIKSTHLKLPYPIRSRKKNNVLLVPKKLSGKKS